jgi:hypothetical protein
MVFAIWQRLYSFDEVRSQAELDIRLELDDAPHAFDERELRQFFQILPCGVSLFQGRPGDNRLDAGVLLFSQLRNPCGFFHELSRVYLTLEKDHLLHLHWTCSLPVIFQQVGRVKQRNFLQPGVAQITGIPEMQMGIDDRKVDHGCSFCPLAGLLSKALAEK